MQLQVYELRGKCIRTQTNKEKKPQQYTFEIRHLASNLCLMIYQDYLNLEDKLYLKLNKFEKGRFLTIVYLNIFFAM